MRTVTLHVVTPEEAILDETHRWQGHTLGGTCLDCGAEYDMPPSVLCPKASPEVKAEADRKLLGVQKPVTPLGLMSEMRPNILYSLRLGRAKDEMVEDVIRALRFALPRPDEVNLKSLAEAGVTGCIDAIRLEDSQGKA